MGSMGKWSNLGAFKIRVEWGGLMGEVIWMLQTGDGFNLTYA
jgi:hypothetical protein